MIFGVHAGSLLLKIAFLISLAAQIALAALLFSIVFQIVILQEYYTVLLVFTSAVAYGSTAIISFVSFLILFGWFKATKRSYVTLIFGLAFAVNVYTFVYVPIYDILGLIEKDYIITAESEVVYSSDEFLSNPGSFQAISFDLYYYLSTGIFLMFVIGSASILQNYAKRIGRLKFWTLLLLPLVYYAGTLVDSIGI
jgi:hypothetical protein